MQKGDFNDLRSVLVLLALWLPIGLLHEFGHIIACNIFGVPLYQIILQLPDFYVVHGIHENVVVNFIVGASGGVLASGVLITTLFICKNIKNETKTGISTWIIWQLTNAVFEALIPSFYIQNLTLLAVMFFPTSYLLARTLVSRQK